MYDKCPGCSAAVEDRHAIQCTKCQRFFADFEREERKALEDEKKALTEQAKKLQEDKDELARKQREARSIRAFFKTWWRPILTGIAGIGVVYTVIVANTTMETKLHDRLFNELHDNLSGQLHDQVLAKFQEPQIQGIVDEAGQKILDKDLLPKVESAKAELRQDVVTLKSQFDFDQDVIAAYADDRRAWDRLRTVADDKSSPNAALAEKVWTTVLNAHGETGMFQGWDSKWPPEFGPLPQHWDLQTIQSTYKRIPPGLDEAFVDVVCQRTEMSTRDRADFAMAIANQTDSLNMLQRAGRHLVQLVNAKLPSGQRAPLRSLMVSYLFGPQWDKMRLMLPNNDAKPTPER